MESYYMKLYIFIANKFGGRKMGIIIASTIINYLKWRKKLIWPYRWRLEGGGVGVGEWLKCHPAEPSGEGAEEILVVRPRFVAGPGPHRSLEHAGPTCREACGLHCVLPGPHPPTNLRVVGARQLHVLLDERESNEPPNQWIRSPSFSIYSPATAPPSFSSFSWPVQSRHLHHTHFPIIFSLIFFLPKIQLLVSDYL